MPIFNGLDSIDFTELDSNNLFNNPQTNTPAAKAQKTESPLDYILTKRITCPVCGLTTDDYTIRRSMLREVDKESDMRTHYRIIDPIRYDISLCVHCGYAASQSNFSKINDRQAMEVMEKIFPNFISKPYHLPISAVEAIERYKMALLCAVVKNVKKGDKGMMCLKTAWLYRDLGDSRNELVFIKNAYKFFMDAFSSENFPIAGMGDATLLYLIADLAWRSGDSDAARRWVSQLLVKRGITNNLRYRGENLREILKEEKHE